MTTTAMEVRQATHGSWSVAANSIYKDYLEQMGTTSLAVKHWWIQQFRKTRMTYKDIQYACKQIVANRRSNKRGKGSILDALADTSPLDCSEADQFCLQETYFGIALLMLALTLGGIVGNLWTQYTWAPQLGTLQALLVVVLLPLQIWIGFSDLPDTIIKRRSELYAKIFFMGFSMGRLYDYSLITTAPRIFSPLALAILLDKFGRPVTSSASTKQHPPHPQSRVRHTRLELFLAIAAAIISVLWFLLYGFRKFTFASFALSFLCVGINLLLLFIHFQLYFYGLCTLRERWNMETMKEEDNGMAKDKEEQPQHFWNLDNINPYVMNADLGYALVVLTMDVLLALVQF